MSSFLIALAMPSLELKFCELKLDELDLSRQQRKFNAIWYYLCFYLIG